MVEYYLVLKLECCIKRYTESESDKYINVYGIRKVFISVMMRKKVEIRCLKLKPQKLVFLKSYKYLQSITKVQRRWRYVKMNLLCM